MLTSLTTQARKNKQNNSSTPFWTHFQENIGSYKPNCIQPKKKKDFYSKTGSSELIECQFGTGLYSAESFKEKLLKKNLPQFYLGLLRGTTWDLSQNIPVLVSY